MDFEAQDRPRNREKKRKIFAFWRLGSQTGCKFKSGKSQERFWSAEGRILKDFGGPRGGFLRILEVPGSVSERFYKILGDAPKLPGNHSFL